MKPRMDVESKVIESTPTPHTELYSRVEGRGVRAEETSMLIKRGKERS